MTRMTRGRCGDDRDDVGTTDHGDHMGTFWGLWGQCDDDGDDRDNVGMTGTMWGRRGRRGDDGDNVGTTKSLKMP